MYHLKTSYTYLSHSSFHNDSDAGWEVGESLLQQTVVCDTVFLKAVEEGCWCVLHLRLLDDHNTLEVGVHTGWLHVSPNYNVGVVASALLGIINSVKVLVKEVIEAFMYAICLRHQYCVTFNRRVKDGSNCVNLGIKTQRGELFITHAPISLNI